MKTKITLATVKSFIKKNIDNLYLNVKSEFDGMTDGLNYLNEGFKKAEKTEQDSDYTLGIKNAYFVGNSRDYFSAYEDEKFIGIHVYNSCGSFDIAIQK